MLPLDILTPLYGLAMALLTAALILWAIPRDLSDRARRRAISALHDAAFAAALASLKRWNIGVWRIERQAEAFASEFVQLARANGIEVAKELLIEWIARAEATNNLLAMPPADALKVVSEFRDQRFPHLKRRRAG